MIDLSIVLFYAEMIIIMPSCTNQVLCMITFFFHKIYHKQLLLIQLSRSFARTEENSLGSFHFNIITKLTLQ